MFKGIFIHLSDDAVELLPRALQHGGPIPPYPFLACDVLRHVDAVARVVGEVVRTLMIADYLINIHVKHNKNCEASIKFSFYFYFIIFEIFTEN